MKKALTATVIEAEDVEVLDEDGSAVDTAPYENITAVQLKNLNGAIRRNLSGFTPPDDLTVSQWAEKKRRLSTEASAEPGPWKNRRTPYLVEIMDAFIDPSVRHITFVAASQVGKALALDTPIPTPDGWTTMGDIQPGDWVLDEHWRACQVTFATDVMLDRSCYKVSFGNGDAIIADAEHLWAVEERQLHWRQAVKKTTELSVENHFIPMYGPGQTGQKYRMPILSIEPAESVPVRCIQVDSSSHLYLAGKGAIPTHNTEAELNIIGYIMDNDPGSILFIHPTNIDAKEFSRLRIAPMLRDTPALKSKVRESRQRDSGNTLLQKTFPGGILTLCGSNEAHALASKPIRYIIGDELDRWAVSAGTEGDPWSLAMARQKTFYNAKAVEVSTPTIAGASPIARSFANGTMERWKTQCPHCGRYSEITWANIRYDHEEKVVSGEKAYIVKSVLYVCPECGCVSTEAEMKSAPSHWEADNPDAYRNGHRSFWLNAFVSQWAKWDDIVLDWLKAQGNPLQMQVVYNTCFGLCWENRGDMVSEGELMDRREDYKGELPNGVLYLTAGVDTQDDRMEYEVIGHGMFGETWHIEYGVVMGRPDTDALWRSLDDVLFDRSFSFSDGLKVKLSMALVDEGGHFTQEVRLRCASRASKKVFVCKGVPGPDRPYTDKPKQMKILDIERRVIGRCWQYQLGVDAGKTKLFDNLRVRNPGPRFNHFPLKEQYSAAYFRSLLSETLVYEPGKKNPWVWKKIPGHERNEALDCMNYAMAAFELVPKNMDAMDQRMKAAHMEAEKGPADTPQPPPPVARPRRRPVQRKRPRRQEEW